MAREPDGWAVMEGRTDRVSSVHDTREEAIEAASREMANEGGGVLRVTRPDGRRPQRILVKPARKPATPAA